MLFATDECLDGRLVRELLRRCPASVVRIQDEGLRTADDETILAWCASNDRVLITHDRETMIGFAYRRVAAAERMPGLVVVAIVDPSNLGRLIEDLVLVVDAALPEELEDQVVYVPL